PQVSILIVGHRSRHHLGPCLTSLFAHTRGVSYEVIFVENANNADGTLEFLAQQFPTVHVVPNHTNLGFAEGNNLAAQHAQGRHLVLLNPDTQLEHDAISALVACAQDHPRAGAWGGQTFLANGAIDPGCQQAGPGLCRGLLYAVGLGRWVHGGLSPNRTHPQNVAVLSGAFMMVTANTWHQVGGFDASFFMYNEEVDLCLRLQRDIGPCIMTPHAHVTHLVGGGAAHRPSRVLAMLQSNRRLDRKYHGPLRNTAAITINWLAGVARYFGSFPLALMGQRARAHRLRAAYGPIVFHPSRWAFPPTFDFRSHPGDTSQAPPARP
ncbi:MAG: glycosyltransferase family 2 protein, partial [Algisphaera sp.]